MIRLHFALTKTFHIDLIFLQMFSIQIQITKKRVNLIEKSKSRWQKMEITFLLSCLIYLVKKNGRINFYGWSALPCSNFFSNKFQELLKHIFALSIFPPKTSFWMLPFHGFWNPPNVLGLKMSKTFKDALGGKFLLGEMQSKLSNNSANKRTV